MVVNYMIEMTDETHEIALTTKMKHHAILCILDILNTIQGKFLGMSLCPCSITVY